jgi:hypothetical protein
MPLTNTRVRRNLVWPRLTPEVASLVAIGVLALVVRCTLVLLTRHSFALVNDGADYSRLATSLAAGHGFGSSHVAPGGGPTALRPPAYPLLLAALYLIVGTHVLAARLLGAVLGSIAGVLVALLIGQLGGSPRRILAGGLIAGILPSMVIASGSVMSEPLFVPLSLGAMSCALAFRHSGRAGWLALAGLLLGLATLTRPIGAVLVIPAALCAYGGPGPRRRVSAGLLGAALAILPCAAWEVRDVVVMHHVIPLTTQDGYFLAGTYNATSAHFPGQPGVWIVPVQDPVMARLFRAHPHAQEVRLNNLFNRAARDYATAHPAYIATVVAYNFLRLFDLAGLAFARAATYGEYGYQSSAGLAEFVSILALLALAIVGALRGGLRGWPAGLWLVPVLLLVVTLPTRANPRFRAPIDPYLVIIASAALVPPRSAPGGSPSLIARASSVR